MPAVMTPHHHSRHYVSTRSSIQKVCIGMGIAFVLAGLAGIIMPGFMGMHLSMLHNVIHLASGALALWVGYSDRPRRAYNFALAFGTVYGLLGIVGFIVGQPGYPGVGHMAPDQNLLRVIPNVLEFGTSDHVVHILIASVLLLSAFGYKKRHQDADRSIVDVQRRKAGVGSDVFRNTTRPEARNSDTDLSRADLGRSDVNRTGDLNRRSDFERKL